MFELYLCLSWLTLGQVSNVDKFPHFGFVHFSTGASAEKAYEKASEFVAQGILDFEILWQVGLKWQNLLQYVYIFIFLNIDQGQTIRMTNQTSVLLSFGMAKPKMSKILLSLTFLIASLRLVTFFCLQVSPTVWNNKTSMLVLETNISYDVLNSLCWYLLFSSPKPPSQLSFRWTSRWGICGQGFVY